jgi:hypothetical protein
MQPATTSPASDRRRDPRAGLWLRALWAGVGLNLLGYVADARWHAMNGADLETTWDQVEAHWLFWLGPAVVIAASLGALRTGQGKGSRGYRYVLWACAVYVPASIWDFWAHAGNHDPFIAHIFLTVSRIAIIVATAYTTHLVTGHDAHPEFFKIERNTRRSDGIRRCLTPVHHEL